MKTPAGFKTVVPLPLMIAALWFESNQTPLLAQQPVSAEDHSSEIVQLTSKAESGDLNAEDKLGRAYFRGIGVSKDETEGRYWFLKAAEAGNVRAEDDLGISYLLAVNLTTDEAEAFRWFSKAAGQGDGDAQLRVGIAYAQGHGVAKNPTEAVSWYRMAADQMFPPAKAELDKIAREARK